MPNSIITENHPVMAVAASGLSNFFYTGNGGVGGPAGAGGRGGGGKVAWGSIHFEYFLRGGRAAPGNANGAAVGPRHSMYSVSLFSTGVRGHIRHRHGYRNRRVERHHDR